MPNTWREVRTPHELPPGLWAVFCDLHVPFHDIKAVEAAISHAKAEKVDGILGYIFIHQYGSYAFSSSQEHSPSPQT